jgi:membrane protein implicated in regulation of membrane protease activity
MAAWIIWIIMAAILSIAEMITSSFYLLLAAFGALAAALLAYLGFSDVAQILTATLVTLIGWGILYKIRPHASRGDAQSNSDMNMDIGATVKISEINDSNLKVNYRGAMWNAELFDASFVPSLTETYLISRISGSTLILTPKGQ